MRAFFLHYAHERGLRGDAGGFRKLWELARSVSAQGWEVTVFYPRLPGDGVLLDVPARAYGVVDVKILRPLTAYISMLLAAVAAGRRTAPDIVYFRSGLNVLPLLLRRVLGARIVLEVNADVQEFLRAERAGAVRRRLFAYAERLNASMSDLVVTLTPGLARMIVDRYGLSPSRVQVIPSGTDCRHFTPIDAGDARRRLGLEPTGLVVGFMGLFYRHQGVPTLLDALAALREGFPDLRGLIVGDGVMRRAWEDHARRLGLGDVVQFTGQVPYARAPLYTNAMDVVVAPFTADRGETSPFKVLDALACERPVVASDIASLRALASDSGAVTLVPPDDPAALGHALRLLLIERERRMAQGRRGRTFVCAQHDWARIGETLTQALGAGQRRRTDGTVRERLR